MIPELQRPATLAILALCRVDTQISSTQRYRLLTKMVKPHRGICYAFSPLFVLDVKAYAYAEGCLPVRDHCFPRRCRSAWTQHPDPNRTAGMKLQLGLLLIFRAFTKKNSMHGSWMTCCRYSLHTRNVETRCGSSLPIPIECVKDPHVCACL